MPDDIKNLTRDLKIFLEDAVSVSAVEIQYSLQHVSPWWTGTFGEAWELSHTPVKPILRRESATIGGEIPPRSNRNPKKVPPIPTKLGKALYVGNLAEYAGFVINARGQTLPNLEGEQVEYWEHAATVRAHWYSIYIKHGSGRFLMKDIDKGFAKAGFKIVN